MHVILHEWLCYFNLYLCDHYFGFTPLHKKANKVLQRWLVLAFYRLALFLKSENVVIYHLLFSTNTAFVHVSHLLIFIKRHLHDWLKYQGRNLFWKWNLYIFSMGENPSLLSSMYYFEGRYNVNIAQNAIWPFLRSIGSNWWQSSHYNHQTCGK